MTKKMLTILLYLVIIFTVFVSCGGENKEGGGSDEYTIFGTFVGLVFDEEWPVFQEASEKTGIKLKGVTSENASNEKEAFNLMVASGNLPDIIRYTHFNELEVLGIDGGLIPLQDLIEEHAPNINKFFDEDPIRRYLATSVDSNIYSIPYYRPYNQNKFSLMHYIRKDWLEKLDLEVPKTIDDYYNMLVAFKTQDPNGNGKNDEIPFFARTGSAFNAIDFLMPLFQISIPWEITKDSVVYTPATEEYKNAIRELAKWYKEGLIDPEYFTRDQKRAREYIFGNNLGGATFDWPSTADYISVLSNEIDGFDLMVIPPPEINGKSNLVIGRGLIVGGWGISVNAKDPVALIKYFDFWFSEEGRRLWNFGIEGETYTMVDGKPQLTDLVLESEAGALQTLYTYGAQWVIGVHQDYEYEKQFSLPLVLEGYQMHIDGNLFDDTLIEIEVLKYTDEERDRFAKLNVSLEDYFIEMTQKWIMGSANVDDDWDAYIKRLNDIGLAEAIALQEIALDRIDIF